LYANLGLQKCEVIHISLVVALRGHC